MSANDPLQSINLYNNRNVIIEVTQKCNLNCLYCTYGEFYNNFEERKNIDQSFENIKSLIKYMTKFWNSKKNSSFGTDIWINFYGGEPLLKFELITKSIDFIESIKLKFNRFKFGLTTNGILLNKYIDYLAEKEIRILISLDGDENSNRFRVFKNGEPSFKKVFNNVVLIKKKYPNYFDDYINFNTVLHKYNSLDKIYSFFKKNFNKIPRYSSLETSGLDNSKEKQYKECFISKKTNTNLCNYNSDIKELLFFKSKKTDDLINYLNNEVEEFYKNYNSLIKEHSICSEFPKGTCTPLEKRMFMDVFGDLFPCERVGIDYVLGKVNYSGVNIDFSWIKDKYNLLYKRVLPLCNTCSNIKNCPNCLLKSDNKKFPSCNYWKDKSFQNTREKSIMDLLRENRELYKRIAEEIFVVY